MNKFTPQFFLLLCLICTPFSFLFSQNTITGTVLDGDAGETVIGAQIRVAGTEDGTITDFDGAFRLVTETEFPFQLQITSAGFEPVSVILETLPPTGLQIVMTPVIDLLNEVVIAASRVEESLLSSPTGIEKINLAEWQMLPQADVFSGLALSKGVQFNSGSYSFPSINTRGFADAQNWRFLHFVDGMEVTSPGLGYSMGNNSGPGELDVRSVELIPGPGSALYGPNAFNGLLAITTKNPWDYPGLSASLKGGAMTQEGISSNPFLEVGLRFARPVSDKFGYKLNVGYLTFTDWTVNDETYHITATKAPFADQFLAIPAGSPNFDAVSRFGDEVQVPVLLAPDSAITVSRTGIAEKDIVDYNSRAIKLGGTMYYRPKEGIEATYDVRFFQGDGVLRHTTIYPLRNIAHFMQKFEIKGDDFYVRAYHSQEDAKDTYAILSTGAFIQEGLKSSPAWSNDYGLALRGEIPGIAAGDHAQARLFADRDIAGPNSEEFRALRQASLNNPDILSGGSQFIEKSGFVHVEAMYDFSDKVPYFDLQEGISYRRFFLNSEGSFFNDGPLGFGSAIPVVEYGAFAQGSRTWWDDRIVMRASLRFDKNQNFEGRVSPKIGVVITPDKNKKHYFRVAAQSGFRNPSAQETYITLDIGDAIILGGTQDNIDNYQYQMSDGALINGRDIHQNLVSIPSVQAFLASGGTNPALLEPLRLDYLRQEQISTAEVGYRGVLFDALFIELTGYYNQYEDFVTRTVGYSLQTNRAFAVYTNIDEQITSYGGEALVEYRTRAGYRVKGTYTYNTFDAETAVEQNPAFLPGFNSPTHRATAWFANDDVYNGIGFSISARWSDSYLWQSPFGQGEIDAYTVLDGFISYKLTDVKSTFKIGASNLLNTPYRTMYGGPEIGGQYYLSMTFDELFR